MDQYLGKLTHCESKAIVILEIKDLIFMLHSIKGELQRQNKLISSERLFKILQNETKIIKIGQAVLEIFNFKDRDLDNFTSKNDRKTENVVFLEDLHRLKYNRLCDIRNDKCIYQQ